MGNRSYDWHGEECHDYDDIIDLPHHVSSTRPQMSMLDRAAQFSPFAALTGYDDVIQETARLTDAQTELSEQEQDVLNEKIALLQKILEQGGKQGEKPLVEVYYFVPDGRKEGGSYVAATGQLLCIDSVGRTLVLMGRNMTDLQTIPLDAVADISGDAIHARQDF